MHVALLSVLALVPAPHVERLGHRDYRVRAAAQRALASWGRLALPALERAAQSHPSAEVRARCACLLRPYAYELADRDSRAVLPSRWPRLPWIDPGCIGGSHHFFGAATPGDAAPDWPRWREATRLWVRSQLLQRRPRAEIVRTLDELAGAERDWIIRWGANYSPAITLPKGY